MESLITIVFLRYGTTGNAVKAISHAHRACIQETHPFAIIMPPEGQYALPDKTVTIAEVAISVGYATSIFGKWGCGFFGTSGDPSNQGV